ncbi:MAG: NAD(P)-dependent oxidoreductase [Achromobacter sp.]|uniref:NAD(P)-dependent oxidoreductase n=1 Tax=Achromobacter sp. TaxID=134375 RepID=UPI002590D041|nr:NAD(P)-dependent oxidoreductase [Achromobacter sp.]MCW0206379.1 NAD(P)-dependent oxidoreductase [Achromobacter sp.]
MESIKTVAFIGAGNMGAPMARRAWRGGFDVMVCDISPATRESFSREGIPTTADVADCAAADAIIVLLANDAQITDALLGERGLANAIPPGHRPVVCMMSTTLPDTLRTLEAPLAAAGARLIDAPVSGGIVGARDGTLTLMLGGSRADIQHVQPLMSTMGKRIFHCGALGSAEVAKIINNMLCVTNMFLTAEAIELAQAHGVAFEDLAPILAVSTGMNFLTADAAMGRAQYRAWAPSEDAYPAIHRIVSKDLHLALALGDLASLDLGLLKQVSSYVDDGGPTAAARWTHAGQASRRA